MRRPGRAVFMAVVALAGASRAGGVVVADAATGSPAPAAGDAAVVEQPRSHGHLVGDMLTQRVLLERAAQAFEPAELPGAQRIGVWLERRAGRIETTADGRRWGVFDYQLINAPREMRSLQMPAFELAGAAGQPALVVPAWTIVVSPLALNEPDKAGLPLLQPDREAPQVAVAPLQRRLGFWGVATLLLLAAWPGWWAWRNWRAASALPFAQAWRSLRRGDDLQAPAWQVLHRAFDAAAGRAVHAGSLPALFRQQPQLETLRPDIEAFYRASAARFFAEGGSSAASATAVSPRSLCAACRRIERQHER